MPRINITLATRSSGGRGSSSSRCLQDGAATLCRDEREVAVAATYIHIIYLLLFFFIPILFHTTTTTATFVLSDTIDRFADVYIVKAIQR